MIKNWKNLFVKSDEDGSDGATKQSETKSYSFPADSGSQGSQQSSTPASAPNPMITEVLKVYESGLESINMPGYDFYEFYQAITSIGQGNEQAYIMAYQMARTLDKTVTAQKLVHDAEFYVSKINEVHSQYVSQGQQKLNGIQEKKSTEKNRLNAEIDQASSRISQLRAELQQLETEVSNKRNTLTKLEDGFAPQEKSIREKLNANDHARQISIDKLNNIKDGILRYIKA